MFFNMDMSCKIHCLPIRIMIQNLILNDVFAPLPELDRHVSLFPRSKFHKRWELQQKLEVFAAQAHSLIIFFFLSSRSC